MTTRPTAAILRHLPYFLAVAEAGSLLAAAGRLNTAQSAISRRIRLLEQELGGTPLFAREARGMRLLPAGAALLEEAQAILDAAGRAHARIQAISGGTVGSITVGFAEIVTRQPGMLGALEAFGTAHPDIAVQLRPLVSEEQRAELESGGIDIGFLYHAPEEDVAAALTSPRLRFAARPLMLDPYLLAIHTDHPLAGRKSIRLADLGQEPIIWASHKKNPRLYDRLLAACERRGYAPRIVMETPTSDVTMAVVNRAMGIGFVPASLRGHAPPDVAFIQPVDFDMAMQLSLVWRTDPDGELPGRLARFLDDKLSNFANTMVQ
ncbi:LysR family transcriptional regulator [Sphingomonas sp. So64.6b]|uniref:LysR family transcriptional regulator n=1 Tax=Sphingomonas sp. So64.6b TaxID=2997354 RepID=UPI0015FFD57F|nr:LysR family transcriptional regulator [Sphingomonas sp. So64.6b]QNA86642.1 LysR family transcriptional regulator [Sphingomonas sp. So64.6b]